jgi:hypothetical protein
MDYAESFRLRFRSIDRQYPRPLAIKKKKDIRRMVMEDGPDDKRASLDVVWAEEREAGRV